MTFNNECHIATIVIIVKLSYGNAVFSCILTLPVWHLGSKFVDVWRVYIWHQTYFPTRRRATTYTASLVLNTVCLYHTVNNTTYDTKQHCIIESLKSHPIFTQHTMKFYIISLIGWLAYVCTTLFLARVCIFRNTAITKPYKLCLNVRNYCTFQYTVSALHCGISSKSKYVIGHVFINQKYKPLVVLIVYIVFASRYQVNI